MDPTTTAIAALIGKLIEAGPLGLVLIAILTGWLVPKPTVDANAKREALKDDLIKQLTKTNELLAKRLDVQRRAQK